jgi:hypothetical protein
MGLFATKLCAICGKATRRRMHNIADGALCSECYDRAGYNKSTLTRHKSTSDVRRDIEAMDANAARIAAFNPTKRVQNYLVIDEDKRQWALPDAPRGRLKRARVYDFDDIVEYELLEDGDTVVKSGLGRAVAGAALFGGVGAIVGGLTGRKNKAVVDRLKIKIVVRDLARPAEHITLLNVRTKANSLIHKAAIQEAREILPLLALMTEGKGAKS